MNRTGPFDAAKAAPEAKRVAKNDAKKRERIDLSMSYIESPRPASGDDFPIYLSSYE